MVVSTRTNTPEILGAALQPAHETFLFRPPSDCEGRENEEEVVSEDNTSAQDQNTPLLPKNSELMEQKQSMYSLCPRPFQNGETKRKTTDFGGGGIGGCSTFKRQWAIF